MESKKDTKLHFLGCYCRKPHRCRLRGMGRRCKVPCWWAAWERAWQRVHQEALQHVARGWRHARRGCQCLSYLVYILYKLYCDLTCARMGRCGDRKRTAPRTRRLASIAGCSPLTLAPPLQNMAEHHALPLHLVQG